MKSTILMKLNKKLQTPGMRWLFLTVFVLGMWLLFRLAQLPKTLFFFNDMGRDLLVVWQSWHDKKPFLLGPQNSALPFNQPALYFYLLYPAFLLTGMSLYTHTVTFFGLIGVLLLLMVKWLWRKRTWLAIFLVSVWLMAIQPQFVIQNRFIWNPSFVPYFIFLAVMAYGQLLLARQKDQATIQLSWKSPALWLWALGLGTAIALSYSVAPLALAFVLLILWQWRWQSLKFATSLAAMLTLWHLPTLAFELRYHFQLTQAVLSGNRPEQVSLGWVEKLHQLVGYFTASQSLWENCFLFGMLLLLVVLNIWQIRRTRTQKRDHMFLLSLSLSLLTLIITFVVPIAVQAHYVFGLFVVLITMIASLRPRYLLVGMAIFSLWWLRPNVMAMYLHPAPRTIPQTDQCGQLVCKAIEEPVFVSVESSAHPYHNGPEWRYIFAKYGCNIQAIETQPQAADTMLVVVDQGNYTHGETKFNELSLFGDSQVKQEIQCPGNVQVEVLER